MLLADLALATGYYQSAGAIPVRVRLRYLPISCERIVCQIKTSLLHSQRKRQLLHHSVSSHRRDNWYELVTSPPSDCTTRVTFDGFLGPNVAFGVVPNGYFDLNRTNTQYINVSSLVWCTHVESLWSALGYHCTVRNDSSESGKPNIHHLWC